MQDDKAKVPLGLTISKKQTAIFVHLDYKLRLPDHDFLIGPPTQTDPFRNGRLLEKWWQESWIQRSYSSINKKNETQLIICRATYGRRWYNYFMRAVLVHTCIPTIRHRRGVREEEFSRGWENPVWGVHKCYISSWVKEKRHGNWKSEQWIAQHVPHS